MNCRRYLLLIFAALLLLGAVGAAPLVIEITPSAAGRKLTLDSLRYGKSAGEIFSVTRLSYLLSGLAFQREDGGWVEAGVEAVWLDAGRRRSVFRLDGIPEGRYQALRFAVGLDAETDAADPAGYPADHPLNPVLNGLHWGWQGGYVSLAIEGHFREAGTKEVPRGYSLHLARAANRTRVHLPVQLDLSSPMRVEIEFDIEALLHAPRSIVFADGSESTHSREGDPVAAALVANLPGAFHVRQVVAAAGEPAKLEKVEPLYLPARPQAYPFKMAANFPMPSLPRDNPLLKNRVALGRAIFNDPLLSRDGTLSCASCHLESHAFSDPRRVSIGIDERIGQRNAMPLFNLAWKGSFFWDGRATSLREQVLMPIREHSELDEQPERVAARLAAAPGYPERFERAFGTPETSVEKIALALENFLLTLTSYQSKFDRAMAGQAQLSAEEKRGFELFMTERDPRTRQYGADCFHCHGGALFSDHGFHDNGLAPTGDDRGKGGKFATPSLRNVALTAPYMHDGRFATLAEVVAHYSSGLHRSETLDPNLAKHRGAGLDLSDDDQRALVAFLEALTDPQFIRSNKG